MASYEEFKKAAQSQSEFEKFKAAGQPRPVGEFAEGAAAGFLGVTKSGGDILAAGLEAITPGEQGYTAATGEVPQTVAGRAGEMAGFAGTLGAMGGMLSAAVPAAGPELTARNATQNFLSEVGVKFKAAPGRFVGGETTLGAGAGAGGEIVARKFPESEGARLIGEILGGGAPGLVRGGTAVAGAVAGKMPVTGAAIRGVKGIGEQAGNLLNPVKARGRAVSRLERGTPSPEGAADAMREPLLPGLTPAAKTGDRGLLALEGSVNKELADSEKFIESSIENVHSNINRAIAEFSGSPEAAAKTFERAQEALSKSLDDRLKVAAKKAEQTLLQMAPDAPRETVNRTAAMELRGALDAARNEERALYQMIPEDAITPTKNTMRKFKDLKADLSIAQKEDMPAIAGNVLGELGKQTSIKELRGLQSKLRQVARNSRSGDNANLNRARIADEIADAITEDIANTQGGDEVAGLVDAAVSYSRELNNKFRKGTVGTLLGLAKQAEPKVPESLVLESSIGLSGPKARQAFDDIVQATDSPEVMNAMEGFIKNKFFDYAVVDNVVNPARAKSFIRTNKEVLNRLPNITKDLEKVAESMDIRDLRISQKNRVNFTNPARSRATMFIQRGPDAAFKSVLDSRLPGREMANLVNMAGRDTTGQAIEGLKSAFSEYIVQKSSRGGEIAGDKMADFLSNDKTKAAMNRLFTPKEMDRWQTIVNTAKRLDLQKAAKPSGEGIIGDQPGVAATMLARVLGASYGRFIGREMGAGGTVQIPGIFSQQAGELLKKGIDPAKKLIIDATQDEDLFRELLLAKVRPDGTLPKQAQRRLNAWIAALPDEENQ